MPSEEQDDLSAAIIGALLVLTLLGAVIISY